MNTSAVEVRGLESQMMDSNYSLVSRFQSGKETGKANRMEIEKADDGSTVLWGYGWAVYALRTPRGNVFKFTGWNGYSPTTTSHMSLISGAKVTEIDDAPESIKEAQSQATLSR
jgi:hypothetical protein